MSERKRVGTLLAIDPGPTESAYCLMTQRFEVLDKGKVLNASLLDYIWLHAGEIDRIACEMVASYGMAVGAEVFETCVMIGRIERTADMRQIPRSRVFRIDEKIRICHDSRAKDANIRRALIDRFARHDKKRGTGTIKNPDWFYGFKSDIWSAFAVGVVDIERRRGD